MKNLKALALLALAATMSSCGGGGPSNSVTTLPTATLTVDKMAVNSGESATLTWNSTSANACHATDGWSGDLATSGTQDTGPLTGGTSFSLTCTNASATSPKASVRVELFPTVTLTATPASIASGDTAQLNWNTTDATTCEASGGWTGDLDASGSQNVGPLTANTTFALVCTGAGGDSAPASATITVDASAQPTATLTASPASIASGATSKLTWSSTNATGCTASNGWTGSKAVSGTFTTAALTATTTYSLACVGDGGVSGTVSATVTVNSTATPKPTQTLTASPTSVASGGTSKLTWTSTNSTGCTASNGWTGSKPVSGTFTTPALAATTTYTLACVGPGGVSTATNAVVTVTGGGTPAPTVRLSAAPTSVSSGSTSTLTWSSTNATACTASNGWTGAKATSGTFTTPALTATSTYTLTCTGTGGSAAANATVTVTAVPVPTATLTASPTTVASGGTSTLTWTSTNSTGCTASNGWTGSKPVSGTYTTPAITATTTYSLACVGPGGVGSTYSATVTVNAATPAPTVNLQATPTSVASGGTSTLTWTTTNATACTASNGWTGNKTTSGTFTTPALTAAATYTLTCTGNGGSGNDSVTVSIVSGSLTPGTVALTVGQVQTFTKTLSGTATYSVDGTTNGNGTVGTISSAGVYTAGTDTGAHTILAVSSADSSQSQSATAYVTDLPAVTTYHYNQGRNGTNTQEYALTPATVKAATFGKIASCTLDGVVVGQTLWAANLTINGAAHNVVFVATMHNGLYALDGDGGSCTPLWHVNLSDTSHGAAAGETSVPGNRVGNGYGDIAPEIGITSTPVIDLPNKIIYVVSKSTNAGVTAMYSRLHAIDMTTGAEKAGSPVTIAGSVAGTGSGGSTVTFDSKQELQRAGLALANGTVFVSFTAHEDNDPWYGWVFGYRYSGGAFTQTSLFNVAPDNQPGNNAPNGGGIWMSGGAPAVDDANNLFLLTGNGHFNADTNGRNYGDSLLKISTPNLAVMQYWTPSTQANDESADLDFGAGGAAMLADLPFGSSAIHVITGGGKTGYLEVLNRDMLGGYTGATLQEINLHHSLFSTAAIWNNRLYVAAGYDSLRHFNLNTTTAQFTLGSSSGNTFARFGANPIVSASGNSNGVVWAMETDYYCTAQSTVNGQTRCGPIILHAFDATDLSKELWKSSAQAGDTAGFAVKFTSPMVANGHVYVGTRGNNRGGDNSSTSQPGTLEIYGLKP